MSDDLETQLSLIDYAIDASVNPEAAAVRLATPLFRAVLLGRLPPARSSWEPVIDLARQAALHLPEGSIDRVRIEFARDVARRHTAEPALLPWPTGDWYTTLSDDDRAMVLAHVVQSASDSDLGKVDEYVGKSMDFLADLPPSGATLRLTGAIGRGLAAIGRYPDAARLLKAAIDGWFMLGQPAEASYPLCELLRYVGLAGDVRAVKESARTVRVFRKTATPPLHRAFVRLALGRAMIQAGDLEGGRKELLAGDDEWSAALREGAEHAVLARWRWLHHAALGEPGGGLEYLEKLANAKDSDQLHLALIDRALLIGDDPRKHVEALLGVVHAGSEAARAIAHFAREYPPNTEAWLEAVKRMAWEYRY